MTGGLLVKQKCFYWKSVKDLQSKFILGSFFLHAKAGGTVTVSWRWIFSLHLWWFCILKLTVWEYLMTNLAWHRNNKSHFSMSVPQAWVTIVCLCVAEICYHIQWESICGCSVSLPMARLEWYSMIYMKTAPLHPAWVCG